MTKGIRSFDLSPYWSILKASAIDFTASPHDRAVVSRVCRFGAEQLPVSSHRLAPAAAGSHAGEEQLCGRGEVGPPRQGAAAGGGIWLRVSPSRRY
jgi:hypothetical protein